MGQKSDLTKADEIKAGHGDFVKSHEDMMLFQQKYRMVQGAPIGQGAFGQVRKATLRANKELRAVKIIDKLSMSAEERVRLMYEIDILKNLNHPNILRLYEVYESKDKINLVTELCDGQELFEAI